MGSPDEAAEPELIEGTHVGDFQLRGLIGEGAMGQVYLAHDVRLGRRVALKLIKRAVMQADGVERFLHEARATASFNHPHIVTLYAVGEHEGRPYLALEYIDGESLRARLAAGPLPVHEALRCCRAVAEAVAEAHQRGLVHADLKPENILIPRDGRVRVVDFGLARLALGTDGAASGTPAYMAPERWRAAPPTGAIDVWALGIMLHELITGRRPISDGDLLRFAFATVPPELPDFTAAPWAGIVRNCLALEPATRPTAEELARRLAELIEPHPTPASSDVRAPSTPAPHVQYLPTEPSEGRSLVELAPDERKVMRCFGAGSVRSFRRYRDLVRACFATMLPDFHVLSAAVRELVADDPEWAHPYALLAFLEGLSTEAGRKVLATARSTANATRDPSGADLLRALELFAYGDTEGSFHLAADVFRQNHADLHAGYQVVMAASTTHRTEEMIAFTRKLYLQHPELTYGEHLVNFYRWEGRDADAEHVIREWVATAPRNVVARVQLARAEADAGQLEEARARAREAVEIHGDNDDALPDLFEALIATEQISEARAIADRMLVGSPLNRARGRYRIATTSMLQGRFAAAYDAVRRAIGEHRAFGIQSELTQCLELARALAPLAPDMESQRRYTEELADVFAHMIGDAGTAAAMRFEVALLDRRVTVSSIDDHLASLEEGPARDTARRRMLRAAAVAGCGSARAAVDAGLSALEDNTASLLAFGLCARRVHELGRARRSFERAARAWSSIRSNQSSPYHAILARFHLAGVLDELGDHAAARAAYEAFLRCWSSSDRPIPEVAIARERLELASPTGR